MQTHDQKPAPEEGRARDNRELDSNFEGQPPDDREADTNSQAFVQQSKALRDATLLKLSGSEKAGRRLIEALGSESEEVRLIAGMGLVNAGQNSVPLLVSALSENENMLRLLEIADSLLISGIGTAEIRAALETLKDHQNPNIASEIQRILRGE